MCVGIVFLSILGFSIYSTIVSAQTRFLWPDSRFSIEKYAHFETCAAVHDRVLDSITAKSLIFYDSLHHSLSALPNPIKIATAAATKRCLAQVTVESIPLGASLLAQTLFLSAGEYEKAKLVVDRKLNSIPADSTALLYAVMDTVMRTYVGYPFAPAVRSALELYDRFEKAPPMQRILMLGELGDLARRANDSVQRAECQSRILSFAKALSPEDRAGWLGTATMMVAVPTAMDVSRNALLDALATSTDAYLALREKKVTELTGSVGQRGRDGTPFPAIHTEFWFPAKPSNVTYPQLGKATLFVSVDHTLQGASFGSLALTAAVRRLKIRFPELDVVLLAQTHGYVKNLEPPPPGQEAQLIDSLFRQVRDVPGVLAVVNTSFWRLPGYDRRRIDEPTELDDIGMGKAAYGWSILVDKEKRIVIGTGIYGMGEELLEKMIPVLIQRQSRK